MAAVPTRIRSAHDVRRTLDNHAILISEYLLFVTDLMVQ